MQRSSQNNVSLEERLEFGELLTWSPCPFALPGANERAFLSQQRLRTSKKNIDLDPKDGRLTGFQFQSVEQTARLSRIMAEFSQNAATWLAQALPRYAPGLRLDRVTFRPEEEATRKLRLTARNDLLHIDAFPSRPSHGWRILRLYVNIHPTAPRVWATSETFPKLLQQFGTAMGIPPADSESWSARLRRGLLRLFQPETTGSSDYDRFMLRFHHFLKRNDSFQERAPRKLWRFPPWTTWLAFTDALSHAELRGRYALEHSFFVAPNTLTHPELAPAAVLHKAGAIPVLPQAA
jgi:hypothetical protein